MIMTRANRGTLAELSAQAKELAVVLMELDGRWVDVRWGLLCGSEARAAACGMG